MTSHPGRVLTIYLDKLAALPLKLVFMLFNKLAPHHFENAAVQSCFLFHLLAGVYQCTFGSRGHAYDVQIFNSNPSVFSCYQVLSPRKEFRSSFSSYGVSVWQFSFFALIQFWRT